MNLWHELVKSFQLNSNNIALRNIKGEDISYRNLTIIVLSQAKEILKYVPKGSRIAILSTHPYYDAINILAVLAAGCIAIPISIKYGESHCIQIIECTSPDLILTNPREMPTSILQLATKKGYLILSNYNSENLNDYNNLDNSSDIIFENIDDVAMIMFTSGTTGRPKGIMLTHENLLSNLDSINEYFTISSKDTILIVRPLCHSAVITGEFLHGLMNGAYITFYDEPFSPRRLLNYMIKIKCTIMCSTPTMFYHISIANKHIDLPFLQKVAISGECLQPQVCKVLHENFPNILFYNVYGLTEASPRVSYLNPKYFSEKVGSVGVALKGVKIKVIDNKGNQVANNEKGELIIQGSNIMKGYWNDPEMTKEKIRNNWLYSGDIAYIDNENFLYIIGRKDHMIIRAGMNIYPQEIENVLLNSSEIKEVSVWEEINPSYGNKICVAVVSEIESRITKKFIIELCRQHLEPYKWPDDIYIVDNLFRNASGKVVRGKFID